MSKQSGTKFTSHDLRVTYATLFWNSGGDIYIISKKLGHTSVKTTMSYVKPSIDTNYFKGGYFKRKSKKYEMIGEELSWFKCLVNQEH